MKVNNFRSRIESAQLYLQKIQSFQKRDWLVNYESYVKGNFGIEEKMALINPSLYSPYRSKILGKRSFKSEVPNDLSSCQGEKIWGYECNLNVETGEVLHMDHIFPYSHGGPTLPSNKIRLCPVHNSLKGTDIHLYPWEDGEPDWLESRVMRILKVLS